MKKKLLILILIVAGIYILSIRKIPDRVDYGVSFSVFHSKELGLDWKKTFDAILNDLKVRRFRLSAHWPLTEPQEGKFNWSELDYQISQAESHDAKVILAVGRRLPGWPECHEPEWLWSLSVDQKREKILNYITAVVNHYKGSPAITTWQVENEPFLTLFATYYCDHVTDADFLKKEVALVKSLDPTRPVLVTDSGELSLWYKAYNAGDKFGTSVYLYAWTQRFGQFRYPIWPGFFRLKRNLVEFAFDKIYHKKDPVLLIELSAEPWLLQPIIDTPVETALDRMDLNKFNEIIDFAKKAGFEEQYLWGAEWWYFMKQNNHPEFWERAKQLFSQ